MTDFVEDPPTSTRTRSPLAYALKDPANVARKIGKLQDSHMAPLMQFVEHIRVERPGDAVPWFDPDDGGVRARLLLLFEAPGPQARGSNFISAENPDPTARNTLVLREEAGIRPDEVLHWNIVPWFVSNGARIRPPRRSEIREGVAYLERLIELLPNLRVILAMGRNAEQGLHLLPESRCPQVQRLWTWHTSNQVFHPQPSRRAEVLQPLRHARTLATSQLRRGATLGHGERIDNL